MVSYRQMSRELTADEQVLILIVVEDGLVQAFRVQLRIAYSVLILIVVEDGLVLNCNRALAMLGLNPYCSGRWSRTATKTTKKPTKTSLNPYCSGRWSRTRKNGTVNHSAMSAS